MEEITDWNNLPIKTYHSSSESKINLISLTAKWSAVQEEVGPNDFKLSDISLTVHPGQLLAVIGHVGAGKVQALIIKTSYDAGLNDVVYRVRC